MLGAIIGDIVGSRFEFNPTNNYNFELFTDECGFTDDTICTVAVADAILRDREFGESIHDWCRRYPHPMGSYGGRFAQWVRSDNPKPYGSYGNGAAMRVSPIAWAHLKPRRTTEISPVMVPLMARTAFWACVIVLNGASSVPLLESLPLGAT